MQPGKGSAYIEVDVLSAESCPLPEANRRVGFTGGGVDAVKVLPLGRTALALDAVCRICLAIDAID